MQASECSQTKCLTISIELETFNTIEEIAACARMATGKNVSRSDVFRAICARSLNKPVKNKAIEEAIDRVAA